MARPEIPTPCLCVVTDRARLPDGADVVETAAAAIRGGAGMIQLRQKDMPARDLLRLARELRAVADGKAPLIVNDRVDVAALAGADGVQLGEGAIDVASARRLLGDGALVGRSVHDVEGAVRAQSEGADYLILGTIFPTASHPGAPAAGLRLVEETARAVSIPILGIGGIDEARAPGLIRAGASGAAAISAISAAPNPARAAARLRQRLSAPPPSAR